MHAKTRFAPFAVFLTGNAREAPRSLAVALLASNACEAPRSLAVALLAGNACEGFSTFALLLHFFPTLPHPKSNPHAALSWEANPIYGVFVLLGHCKRHNMGDGRGKSGRKSHILLQSGICCHTITEPRDVI